MQNVKEAAENLDMEYRRFLTFISENYVKLSSRTGNLGKKDCAELNRQFKVIREPYRNAARTQEYYAVIDFFHYFSWQGSLLQEVKRKGGGYTLQATDRCAQFLGMAPIEKYLMMLAVWFCGYREASIRPYQTSMFLPLFMETGAGETLQSPYGVNPWEHSYYSDVRLFALFGLLQLNWLEESQKQAADNKFCIKSLVMTELGALWKEANEDMICQYGWLSPDGFREVLVTNGQFVDGYNGEMESRIMAFLANPVEEGRHTVQLKISVASCTRRVTLGDQASLDDLHYFIQRSVNFGMDHLYYFQFGNGSRLRRYYAPECEDEDFLADTVSLAKLHLYEGMHFLYLFDFGDQWQFKVTVEKIQERHLDGAEITVLEGEDPEQYAWELE